VYRFEYLMIASMYQLIESIERLK